MLKQSAGVLALCLVSGCHRPAGPAEPMAQAVVAVEPGDLDILFEACLDALRSRRFSPDRVDRYAGVITTFPVTSQQFFEFWRHDVGTDYDLLEASLGTIRRRVEIRLLEEDHPGRRRLAVAVYRERFSTPDRQYNSSAAALMFFSRSMPSTAGRRIVPIRDETWLPAGRDPVLEGRLLAEIEDRVLAAGWSLTDDGPAAIIERPIDG